MTPEKFNLTWNDFEKCASNSFKELLGQQEFVDVTLVSEDDKQIKAHKVVLSACSPILKQVFVRNPHQHPLIFLSGVKYQELESLVNFMYLGQVEVCQNDLEIFMTSAERFQVKGLCKKKGNILVDEDTALKPSLFSQSENEEQNVVNESFSNPPYTAMTREIRPALLSQSEVQNVADESFNNLPYPVMKQELSFGDLSQMEASGYGDDLDDSSSLSKRNNGFTCEQCGYKAKLKHHMQAHIKAKHEGIKFPCNMCEYKASFAHNLNGHKRSKHGVC